MILLRRKLQFIIILFSFLMPFFTGCSIIKTGLIERILNPSVEASLNDINVGINIIRTNHDILYNMPVSVDAEWVDQILDMPSNQTQKIQQILRTADPYYSTVGLTKRIQSGSQGGNVIIIDYIPTLTLEMYNRIDSLYTEWPDVYCLPRSINEYKQFPNGRLKEVIAVKGRLYQNVENAIIDLSPDSFRQDLINAKDEWQEKSNVVSYFKQECAEIEAFIKNKANKNSFELNSKKTELETKKEELKVAVKNEAEKKLIFFELLKRASVEIKSNYDPSKVTLAKKVSKLLNIVKNGANEAITLFGVGSFGIYSSLSQLKEELKVLEQVKVASWFHVECKANQKLREFIDMRKNRIAKNALLAIPNVTLGTYFAYQQSSLARKYDDFADTIIEAYNAEKGIPSQKSLGCLF